MDVVAPLRHSLQKLAQPPAAQVALFPSLVVVGDELALGFDAALRAFRAAAPEASAPQLAALQQLEEYLRELSGPQNEAFWIEAIALAVDPRWARVRELSRAVLVAFHWPLELPEPVGASHVSEDRVVRNG